MAVSGQVIVKFDLQQTSVLDNATATLPLSHVKTYTFTDGAGANQVNEIWTDTRTLTASATEDLDLAGVLTNSFGVTVAFARVKLIYVEADPGNTNNVLVGGAATAQLLNWVGDATDKITVRPNGCALLMAPDATGYAVTATTGDLLKLANSAGTTSVTYRIFIVGSLT